MQIYFGSDHAGYNLKEYLQKQLEGHQEYNVVDLGAFSEESLDYPDIAHEVADKVLENPGSLGVLICGTGIGMSMAANVVPGVRAAVCTSIEMAEMTRKHNNANVLCLGARITDESNAHEIMHKFLETKFENNEERHVRRVNKIEAYGS